MLTCSCLESAQCSYSDDLALSCPYLPAWGMVLDIYSMPSLPQGRKTENLDRGTYLECLRRNFDM